MWRGSPAGHPALGLPPQRVAEDPDRTPGRPYVGDLATVHPVVDGAPGDPDQPAGLSNGNGVSVGQHRFAPEYRFVVLTAVATDGFDAGAMGCQNTVASANG